ncbi:MAG: ethanolamine ammonia-lyase subunit EutC [Thiomonas sp.]
MNEPTSPPPPEGGTDSWAHLRRYTRARIALGRRGASLPTAALLDFGLAHAQARDAVHTPLDLDALDLDAQAAGLPPSLRVHSAASDRAAYLRRPDLGRQLDPASRARLAEVKTPSCDVVFVIADGLSARAAQTHAVPLIAQTLQRLPPGWRVGPLVLACQARVALGDEIGSLLRAAQVVMCLGERPGLTAPDSLGLYLTHGPSPGLTDAQRNCISNVRPEGLPYAQAAHKLAWLLAGARRLGLSGVGLKDESEDFPADGLLHDTRPNHLSIPAEFALNAQRTATNRIAPHSGALMP